MTNNYFYYSFLYFLLGLQFLFLPAVAETKLTQSDLRLREEENKLLCTEDVANKIESLINSPPLARSQWGILVKNLDSQTTLYGLNADKYFIPASSSKLLTSAVALLELGDKFRIRTPVYSVGNLPNLTSLRIEGQGDPTISTQSLQDLVTQLKEKGVQHIEQLIVDNSYFDRSEINSTWEWFDLYTYYATSVSSIILNENAVTLTLLPQKLGEPVKLIWSDAIAARQWQVENNVTTAAKDTPYNVDLNGVLGQPTIELHGTLAIDRESDVWDLAVVDPANYFLESLRHLLSRSNISVTRGVVIDEVAVKPGETELMAITSPPLSEISIEINRESNNLYAEALLKILAKQLDVDEIDEVFTEVLAELGIDGYSLVDGSGLSRHNLVTPETLVQTLTVMGSTPMFASYLNSLAVSGVNGTLKTRFLLDNLQGNIFGKTGTLSGVASLSGYMYLPNQETLAFSILVNNSDLPSRNLRQAIDRIVFWLSRIKRC